MLSRMLDVGLIGLERSALISCGDAPRARLGPLADGELSAGDAKVR